VEDNDNDRRRRTTILSFLTVLDDFDLCNLPSVRRPVCRLVPFARCTRPHKLQGLKQVGSKSAAVERRRGGLRA